MSPARIGIPTSWTQPRTFLWGRSISRTYSFVLAGNVSMAAGRDRSLISPTLSNGSNTLGVSAPTHGGGDAHGRTGPPRGWIHLLPSEGRGDHRVRVDLRRVRDHPHQPRSTRPWGGVRDLRPRDVHRHGPAPVRAHRVRDPPRLVLRERCPRADGRRARPPHAVPGQRRRVLDLHRADGALVRRLEPLPLPIPRGPGPRWDARDRPSSPVGVPAAPVPRTVHGVPRLLLAGRVPPRDPVLVRLHHPARGCVAAPLPRGCVPRVHRLPLPPRRSGEPVLPGEAGATGGGVAGPPKG